MELALISKIYEYSFLDTTPVYEKPALAMMRIAMDSVQVPQTRDEKPIWVGSEEEIAKLCGLR